VQLTLVRPHEHGASAFCLFLHDTDLCWSPFVAMNMQAELDRFCNAMIAIREEIKNIEEGRAEK